MQQPEIKDNLTDVLKSTDKNTITKKHVIRTLMSAPVSESIEYYAKQAGLDKAIVLNVVEIGMLKDTHFQIEGKPEAVQTFEKSLTIFCPTCKNRYAASVRAK